MIVDERFNGGGSAADYIIDFCNATSTAISTTSRAIVIRLPVLQPEFETEGDDH